MFLKAFEIHRLTGATVGFSKILLGAVFNLFVLSIFTSIFNRHGANADENKTGYIPENRPLNSNEHQEKYAEEMEIKIYPTNQNQKGASAPLAPP